MKILFIFVATSIFCAECCTHKKTTETKTPGKDSSVVYGKPLESIPSCVQLRIDSIKLLPKWNPPAEVNEYVYQGKHVYLFSADCCDQFNMLYDENCNPVCAPSGGFTGRGNGKCPEFMKEAELKRLVWKDPR